MKFHFVVLIAFLGAGCASTARPTGDTPITEALYRQAARRCHAKTVLRLRRGEKNVLGVRGLVDPKTNKPLGDDDVVRIKCVQHYLGIPDKDVMIFYS